MNDVLTYFKMTVRETLRNPGVRTPFYGLKYYSVWRKFQAADRNSVDDQMPWMSFPAVDFLKKIIRPDMHVFEYGSGGSTLFWASRVQRVISVEHDRDWFERMQQVLILRQLSNVTYLLREAHHDPDYQKRDFHSPDDYVSSDQHYAGKNFEAYVKVLDEYPDESFDVIIVDGRARPSCIKHGLKKIKRGGYLIVDNSERKYYLAPFSFNNKEWQERTIGGPMPYLHHHSDTTFLMKRTGLLPQTTGR